MPTVTANAVLNTPIEDLFLSKDFKAFSSLHHYHTLEQLIRQKASVLLQQEGTNYHLMQKYTEWLTANHLAHLLTH